MPYRGKVFTKLDLTAAYQQMLMDETSSKLVTINTTKGIFRYTQLPFGVASAPAVFQKTMETILQGMPQVICYLDDILITGRTEAEHAKNLEEVLCRLQEHGVRLKREMLFFQTSVEYLGHNIDAKGVHTTKSKVKAIQDAPIPTNVQELCSFLGLLNYYAKFFRTWHYCCAYCIHSYRQTNHGDGLKIVPLFLTRPRASYQRHRY